MITVRCKSCNTIVTSRQEHDYNVCGCENQTYVQGDIMGGNDLNQVVQVSAPREEKELKLGTEAPKKRRTRLIDVDIR